MPPAKGKRLTISKIIYMKQLFNPDYNETHSYYIVLCDLSISYSTKLHKYKSFCYVNIINYIYKLSYNICTNLLNIFIYFEFIIPDSIYESKSIHLYNKSKV